MADAVVGRWTPEKIPNDNMLYCRVHKGWFFPKNELSAGFFNELEMSTDWHKYSSAEEARQRAKDPDLNAVVSFIVGEVRDIDGQSVVHDPLPDNRAHTHILGVKKSNKTRLRFVDIHRVEIPLPPTTE